MYEGGLTRRVSIIHMIRHIGKRTGKGKMMWPDGNVYEGDWVDDKRTGKGKFTWSKGSVYEGDSVDDKRTGKGKYTWPNGNV